METSSDPLEVVIVGAGPSGLVSSKTLLEQGIENILVLEESSACGGLWNFQDSSVRTAPSCFAGSIPVPSSAHPLYEGLRTNFPKDASSFLGFSYEAEADYFLEPDVVNQYYRRYAKHYQLDRVVHYNERVTKCWKEGDLWKIASINPRGRGDSSSPRTNDDSTHDRIWTSRRLLVCNGHYCKAYCPPIEGLQYYEGRLSHSSGFSSPKDDYLGNCTLIVGGSISGSDIASLLLQHQTTPKTRIVISVRRWNLTQDILLSKLKRRGLITIRPAIRCVGSDGKVHFESQTAGSNSKPYDDDGLPETECPDTIIFATGYRYHFPFLPLNGGYMRADGYKMTNLYRRVLFVDDPSLAFIGITNINFSPAIVQEYQARWYAKMVVIEKCRRLTKQNMMQEVSARRDDPTQDALKLQFPPYCNSLAKDIGARGYWMQLLLDRLPLHFRTMWVRRHPAVFWVTALLACTIAWVAKIGASSWTRSSVYS